MLSLWKDVHYEDHMCEWDIGDSGDKSFFTHSQFYPHVDIAIVSVERGESGKSGKSALAPPSDSCVSGWSLWRCIVFNGDVGESVSHCGPRRVARAEKV